MVMFKGEVKEGEMVIFFYDVKDGVGYCKGVVLKLVVCKKFGVGEMFKGCVMVVRKLVVKKGVVVKGKVDKLKVK